MSRICLLLLLLGLIAAPAVRAQRSPKAKTTPVKPTDGDLDIDEFGNPTIVLDTLASQKQEKRKKKWKKKLFYGFKTRKGFTKRGSGDKVELELFYTLKKPEPLNPYLMELREVYWFHSGERKIKKGPIKEKEARYARILHGPYQKTRDGQVLEEGIYYLGARHGRWVSYDANFVLLEKEKYRKGWLKDGKVTFYDARRQKVDEVYPSEEGGEMAGDYYKFHENGQIAMRGQYQAGVPVGRWVAYYPFLRRTHKELQYPESPYEGEVEPVLMREYDRSQRLIYDHEKLDTERKKKEEEERKAEWRRRALDGTLDEMKDPLKNP